MTGVSDHFVSEALYLRDPDGHGIEIYADRPRELWEGQVARMTTEPLDLENLLRELDDPEREPFDGLPGGTVMGHVHLQVADIPETLRFYRDVMGFDEMATLGSQATFLSAGGYHHHVGANTWASAGAPPPPEGSASLRLASVVLPDSASRDEVVGRVAATGQDPEDPKGRSSGTPPGTAWPAPAPTSSASRAARSNGVSGKGTRSRMRVSSATVGLRRPSTSGLATEAPTGVTRCSQSEERKGVRTGPR